MTVEMKNQQGQWRHYLASFDAHTQESYLIFLAAIGFEDRILSERESNYIQGLSDAISGISIDSVIVQLHTINAARIEQLIQSLSQKHLELLFFVDAVLMCMSVTGIDERESILLSNLSNTLQLPDAIARFGVNAAIAIIKKDQSLFRECLDTIDLDYDLQAVYQCYIRAWIEDKISLECDISNAELLGGSYIVYKPIHISQDTSIRDCELKFAKHGCIVIESQFKLIMESCQITDGNLKLETNAELILNNLNFYGGKGISAVQKTIVEIHESKFYESGILASKTNKLSITNTEFHSSYNKPYLEINECPDAELNGCAFINDPPRGLTVRVPIAGAIKAQDSSIYICNSSFTNCRSSEDGGAINLHSCLFGIDNCKFFHCHSNKNGGAIAISGKSFGDTDYINAKGPSLKSFLSSVKPVKPERVDEESSFQSLFMGLFFKTEMEYSMGSEHQPLISKSHFSECSAAIAGGAILDATDSLRLLESDFHDNNADENPGDVALIGNLHITKWGVDTYFMRGTSLSNKTIINDSLSKIVNCKFISDSSNLQPGLSLTRIYRMLFMSGCSFINRNVRVEYDSIEHEQAGVNFLEADWFNVLNELEQEFTLDIRGYNKFVQSAVDSSEKVVLDELDELEAVEKELLSQVIHGTKYISYDRQHLKDIFLANKKEIIQ